MAQLSYGAVRGYMVAVLLTGYVLLFEENEWLKKGAVKTVALMMFFSLLTAVINLIPNVMSFINSIVSSFGVNFYIMFIDNLIDAVVIALSVIEKLLFIGLGLKALNQGTISVPVVDQLIAKYME